MKKYFSLSAMVLMILAAFSFSSCSKTDADKFVGVIKDATEKVSKLTPDSDDEQFEAIGDKFEEEVLTFKNSTYELTDADRKNICDATINLQMAMRKYQGRSEWDAEKRERKYESMLDELKGFRTLGDFVTWIDE